MKNSDESVFVTILVGVLVTLLILLTKVTRHNWELREQVLELEEERDLYLGAYQQLAHSNFVFRAEERLK
jgi:hypothetical protein